MRSPRDVHEQDRCVLLGNVHEQGVFRPCSGLGTPQGAARHHRHASGAHEQLSDSRACRVSGSQRRMDSILLRGHRLVKEGESELAHG